MMGSPSSGRSTYGPNGRARDVGTRCWPVVRSIGGALWDHFRLAGRLWDDSELVGGKDVCIRNVADIGPVEEIGVVTNLEVRAALFRDLGEAWDSLAVTWSVGEIVMSVVIMWSSPTRESITYPKMPAGRRATVSKPSVPLAARTDEFLGFCLGLVVGIERLFGKRNSLVNVDEVLAVEDHTSGASVYEFGNFVFLSGGNDGLGAVYVYLPVECWVLKTGSRRSSMDDTCCTTLRINKKRLRNKGGICAKMWVLF